MRFSREKMCITIIPMIQILSALLLVMQLQRTNAFGMIHGPHWNHRFKPQQRQQQQRQQPHHHFMTALNLVPTTQETIIFDFSNSTSLKEKSISSFERIDDAIMGGISLSALKDVPSAPYASWSGICRTDGGGFCGMRTLPFVQPLNATGFDGVYVDCRLASDDEPEKRVWKMTLRTDSSRGEQVFQSEFDLAQAMKRGTNHATDDGSSMSSSSSSSSSHMARVYVPFDKFQMVRGPRLVPDGPKLNVTGGIFQIGMTLSKFKMAQNTTVLDDFKAGYFDLHISKIGFYSNPVESDAMETNMSEAMIPDTLSKREAERKRPLPLRVLLPIAKLLFSEKANRRKSAMNILKEKRKMSRMKAILFGIKSRRKSIGIVPSIVKTIGIIAVDSTRTIVKQVLKLVFLYPLRLIGFIIRSIKTALGMKVKQRMTE